eukprot:766690_1
MLCFLFKLLNPSNRSRSNCSIETTVMWMASSSHLDVHVYNNSNNNSNTSTLNKDEMSVDYVRKVTKNKIKTFQRNATDELELLPEEIPLENHIFASYGWYRMLRHYVLCDTFQSFILLLIVVSSVNLAVDSPTLSAQVPKMVIGTLDTVLVIIFTIEMILKIFIMGLVGMEGAYLNDTWNQLDAGIVITSIIPKILGSSGGILGTFRVLRAFRPLRIAARYEELRIVLTALGRSLPAMFNVFGVLLFFWLIFGILSVQLFGGKFYDCYGLDEDTYLNIATHGIGSTDMAKCESMGGVWLNSDYHFDNILDALKALFVISTLEGWHTIMYHAVDSTAVDQLPSKNASEMAALFFILFILVGSFFLISLFVGIIFDNFVKLRDEATGVGMLDPKQKQWVNLQTKIINAHPIPLPLPPSLMAYKNTTNNFRNKKRTKIFNNLLHNIDLSTRREEDNNFRNKKRTKIFNNLLHNIDLSTRREEDNNF